MVRRRGPPPLQACSRRSRQRSSARTTSRPTLPARPRGPDRSRRDCSEALSRSRLAFDPPPLGSGPRLGLARRPHRIRMDSPTPPAPPPLLIDLPCSPSTLPLLFLLHPQPGPATRPSPHSLGDNRPTPLPSGWGRGVGRMAPRNTVCTPRGGWRGRGTNFAGLRDSRRPQSCQVGGAQSCPRRRTPQRTPLATPAAASPRCWSTWTRRHLPLVGPRGPGGTSLLSASIRHTGPRRSPMTQVPPGPRGPGGTCLP